MDREEIAHYRDRNSESYYERPLTDQELLSAHHVNDIVLNDKGSLGVICKVKFDANQQGNLRVGYAVNWMVRNNGEPYAWFNHDDLISQGNVITYYQHVEEPV